MKKGYIVSWFNSGRNYGQTLQAYALQKKLADLGYDVEHLSFGTNRPPKPLITRRVIDCLRMKKSDRIVQKKFDIFISKNMRVTKYLKDDLTIKEYIAGNNPDFLICGSDQVWNPYNADPLFYLYGIGTDSVKKIAYAVSTCDDKRIDKFKEFPEISKWMHGLDNIFVRENSGKKIFKDLYGIDSKVVLDPTLLFSGQEWIENLNLHNNTERYILCYAFNLSEEQKNIIEGRANVLKCKVKYGNVLLNSCELNKFEPWSPIDFLNAIYNACEVYTDSFHGTVFSILFHKEFWIFDNGKDISSDPYYNIDRMQTLLCLIGLEDRMDYSNYNSNKFIDYEKVDCILLRERKECISLLERSIQ